MTWILLFSAAAFEVVWALALKASDGFSKLAARPLIFVVGIVASMVLLALAMRQLAVGTAYAVWTGTGAVGAALAGIALFGDAASAAAARGDHPRRHRRRLARAQRMISATSKPTGRSSWAKPHDSASRSGRQRRNVAGWRKKPPSMWS